MPHVVVSCVECVSPGLLFERVLGSLFDSSAVTLSRSPSLSDFVRLYRQLCAEDSAKHTRYIVSVHKPTPAVFLSGLAWLSDLRLFLTTAVQLSWEPHYGLVRVWGPASALFWRGALSVHMCHAPLSFALFGTEIGIYK